MDDFKGLKMRGPTRVITGMLKSLGATPVGMPVPKVAPSSKENKLPLKEPPPFRLNTRQGYNYKRHIASHVVQKNKEVFIFSTLFLG